MHPGTWYLPTQGALLSSEDESALFLSNLQAFFVQDRRGIHLFDLNIKTFSERAKPEQSGDAKPRVLI